MTGNRTLKEKEKLFCVYYCLTGNAREAAAKAGYSLFPEKNGQKLLSEKRISAEIKRLKKLSDSAGEEAAAGYRRIAYGCVCDAVSLLFKDIPPEREELEKLDLFCVSEIKRPKGGGMEIKFFDRLKALEKLAELSRDGKKETPAFYEALEKGARAIAESEEKDE